MPRDVEVKIKMTEVPAVERTLRSARRLIERLTPPAPGSRSWWTWPSTRMWPATRVALAVLVLVAWVVADGELAAYLFGFAWALLVTVVADLIVGLYVQAGERRNALSHGRHPAATEKARRTNQS